MCVCVWGDSKSSKPHADFRFVVYLSHLYGPHQHTIKVRNLNEFF